METQKLCFQRNRLHSRRMKCFQPFKNGYSVLALTLLTESFLTSWRVSGFYVAPIPSMVKFLRSRRTDDAPQHRCDVPPARRHPQVATQESIHPCNVTRLLQDTTTTSVASSFALQWNLGSLRQAVRELKSTFVSRVSLSEPHPSGFRNGSRLPMEPRQNSRDSTLDNFDEMAQDLRHYYVSINEAEEHERSQRSRRLNTLERELCYVRGHLNNVLCALHATLAETTVIDIQALERLSRYLSEMRSLHPSGTVDVWISLLFTDLDNYLDKMQEIVASLAG